MFAKGVKSGGTRADGKGRFEFRAVFAPSVDVCVRSDRFEGPARGSTNVVVQAAKK